MKQLELPAPFEPLFRPFRYKAFYGGRGSAKSHSFAQALLLIGGQQRKRILCAREVQASLKDSVKELLDNKIEQLQAGDFYQSTQTEIRGKNGTSFIFSGLGNLTTDQIKSYEGVDIVWVEEAQTISKRSLEILIPTIRKEESELWFSWNPRHQSDPVDMRFRGLAVPENAIIRKVNYTENPFFPRVLDEERQYDLRFASDRYGHIWLGDYEPVAVGAIWSRQVFHDYRVTEAPPLTEILVAVDHAVSTPGEDNPKPNEHGIIVGARGEDNRGYLLEDASLYGSPHQWATRAIAMFDKWEADAVVVETNQGGDLVKNTLRAVRADLPIREVHASRGKHVRAEPVAALYTTGRISHVGTFTELEDQMCMITTAGYEGNGSPDRADAAVWLWSRLFPRMAVKKGMDAKKIDPQPRRGRHQPHGYLGA